MDWKGLFDWSEPERQGGGQIGSAISDVREEVVKSGACLHHHPAAGNLCHALLPSATCHHMLTRPPPAVAATASEAILLPCG